MFLFELRRRRSIYSIVLVPLLVMFVAELTVIIGIPLGTGILRELNHNEEELVQQHTIYREGQLETVMGISWSDLDQLSDVINDQAEEIMMREQLTMEQLQQNSTLKDELLLHVTDELITELYIRRVNSIYLVLNTQDLTSFRERGTMPTCSGLCIQDLDPLSVPSTRYMDLLLKRAPISVVREMGISTDSDWKPVFIFGPEEDPARYDFLYQPFQTAYDAATVEDPARYGYWTLSSSRWYGNENERFLTYSQPLVLDDGTVYGVLGVELREEYLSELLPHEELVLNDEGSYALAKVEREGDTVRIKETLISSSRLGHEDLIAGTVLTVEGDAAGCLINGEKYYATMQPVSIYGNAAPYETDDWMLLGLVKESDLYRASRTTEYTLGVATLLMLLIGLVGSLFITERLSKPVQKLSAEVEHAQQTLQDGVPKLTRTNVKEYDQFAEAFTALSEDLVNTSARFLRIIEGASGEIGGFEFYPGGGAFVTDNFFSMLGMEPVPGEQLTADMILAHRSHLQKTVTWVQWHDGSEVYELMDDRGHTRDIKISTHEQDGVLLGLAEDVTALMAERKRMEHDRDYDLLTGLMNRRAFYREVERVFRSDARGKYAAVIMMDLDDLKKVNDRFGHEWGDQYLRQAAWCFSAALPSNAILARLAGDEFAAVFYGYDDENVARRDLRAFEKEIYQNYYVTPDEVEHPVKVSGGVAWYPKDGTNFPDLLKYADFALYQVKRGQRGVVGEFDFGSYNQEIYLAQNRQELDRLFRERLVDYHFQPIFSAATGEPFAYEALMRVKLPTLQTPTVVLNLAREENRMKDIERLTMECSTEAFAELRANNQVNPDAYLFINSIADQWLEENEQRHIAKTCRDFVDKIVIEITEHNVATPEVLEKKRDMRWFSGLFALDDYGTGYNGEKNLLELAPKFVKLDICLVRGLDTDVNKQQIVSHLLTFAHQRGTMVIAEGLETLGEIQKALELGVDLMQGFALARPAEIPGEISPAAMQVIREFHESQNQK